MRFDTSDSYALEACNAHFEMDYPLCTSSDNSCRLTSGYPPPPAYLSLQLCSVVPTTSLWQSPFRSLSAPTLDQEGRDIVRTASCLSYISASCLLFDSVIPKHIMLPGYQPCMNSNHVSQCLITAVTFTSRAFHRKLNGYREAIVIVEV